MLFLIFICFSGKLQSGFILILYMQITRIQLVLCAAAHAPEKRFLKPVPYKRLFKRFFVQEGFYPKASAPCRSGINAPADAPYET